MADFRSVRRDRDGDMWVLLRRYWYCLRATTGPGKVPRGSLEGLYGPLTTDATTETVEAEWQAHTGRSGDLLLGYRGR